VPERSASPAGSVLQDLWRGRVKRIEVWEAILGVGLVVLLVVVIFRAWA
jgi:hypothetical protein